MTRDTWTIFIFWGLFCAVPHRKAPSPARILLDVYPNSFKGEGGGDKEQAPTTVASAVGE